MAAVALSSPRSAMSDDAVEVPGETASNLATPTVANNGGGENGGGSVFAFGDADVGGGRGRNSGGSNKSVSSPRSTSPLTLTKEILEEHNGAMKEEGGGDAEGEEEEPQNENGDDEVQEDDDRCDVLHENTSMATDVMGNQMEDKVNRRASGRGGRDKEGDVIAEENNDLFEEEIEYNEGATDLFNYIEEGQWDLALQAIETHPSEVRIWVHSTGTENTTFNWSVWRRLPIHEACRRQPPPQLVAALLSAYPESATKSSHFGELPIHLAAGCGACLDVVNLLIAAHPAGVLANDNGGRTPLEVLDEAGVQDTTYEGQNVIDTLRRATSMAERTEIQWENRLNKLRQHHESVVLHLRVDHESALAGKDEIIDDLRRDIDTGNSASRGLQHEIDSYEAKIASKNAAERRLMDRVQELEGEISSLRSQNRSHKDRIKELENVVKGDVKTIHKLNGRVDELTKDLADVYNNQDVLVNTALRQAETDLRTMIDSQRVLMREVHKRKEAVRSKLTERGIAAPPPSSSIPGAGIPSGNPSGPSPSSSPSPKRGSSGKDRGSRSGGGPTSAPTTPRGGGGGGGMGRSSISRSSTGTVTTVRRSSATNTTSSKNATPDRGARDSTSSTSATSSSSSPTKTKKTPTNKSSGGGTRSKTNHPPGSSYGTNSGTVGGGSYNDDAHSFTDANSTNAAAVAAMAAAHAALQMED